MKQWVAVAMSGGVDSSVAAILLQQAVGNQLYCVHIDNGLMIVTDETKLKETVACAGGSCEIVHTG